MDKTPYFKRSPRLKLALPTGKIVVHRPKNEPDEPKFSIESMIIPIFVTVVSVGIMFYLSKTLNRGSTYAVFMLAMSIPMLGSYLATIGLFFRKKSEYRKEIAKLHKDYIAEIKKQRLEVKEIRDQQTEFLRQKDPDPSICLRRIEQRESALWERTPNTEDFLHLRLGLGTKPFVIDIKVPEQNGYEVNPLIAEAQKIKNYYLNLVNVPVTIPLRDKRVVGLVGKREEILELIRVLTLQIATHHSPNEVKTVVMFEEEEQKEWEWMRWLPHIWDDSREFRFIASGKESVRKLCEVLFQPLNIRVLEASEHDKKVMHVPEFLFFIGNLELLEDDGLVPLLLKRAEKAGTCTFLMAETKEELPMECQLVVEVNGGVAEIFETYARVDEERQFTDAEKLAVDQLTLKEAKEMARAVAPLRVKQSSAGVIPKVLTFLDMYNVNRVEELAILSKWQENRYPLTLPVPIGAREGGKLVYLNIHDKIEKKGHGPHGLMAGTTGSGKSEVIQSMILSLAVQYHPHEMAFMLIDYKGGGMSNTFRGLPHVVATITNLEDPNLIQRAKVSLRAELERRQKLFNEAGNIQHIDEYFKSDWRLKEPLPHLFIVIDEFAQLKQDQPEFMDELISIAAIGRTLGVHLLLATQKPAGVVNDKIWSNSRFRICLRVQDDTDSREMIKIPNASRINIPGRGYFQVGSNEILEYFQSAWSGAVYDPEEKDKKEVIEVFEVNVDATPKYERKRQKTDDTKPKQIEALIQYMKQLAESNGIQPLPGPWLPPLPEQLPLTQFIPIDHFNHTWWESNDHALKAVVGLIDDVRHQEQYPLEVDLSEGHLIVYGMPGSGKTTFLQSLLMALFFTYAPSDVHVYIVDFSRQMREFEKFPHVGSVINEDDLEKMKRLFKFMLQELAIRKEKFADAGVNSLKSYREVTGEHLPYLVLVMDGYPSFKKSFEEEHEQFEGLLRSCATYGMITVATINQTTDMFDRIRNNFISSVSFELADTADYYGAVGRPNFTATNLPEGRGFVKGAVPPLSFQCMLPYEGADETARVAFFRTWHQQMNDIAGGVKAPPIPLLPKELALEEIMDSAYDKGKLPYGIDMGDLQVQKLPFEDTDHIFITGRIEGGKTSLLQTMVLSLMKHYTPEELDLYLIELEPKAKGVMSFMQLPHIKGHATNLDEAKTLLMALKQEISERKLDDPLYFPDESSSHSFSKVVVVIDDVDQFMQQISMDFEIKSTLEALTKDARLKNVHFYMAGTLASMNSFTHETWFVNIKKKFTGFLLGSTLSSDLYFFNLRIPHAETDRELKAGDGYMIRGKQVKVRVAKPFGQKTLQHWLDDLTCHAEVSRRE